MKNRKLLLLALSIVMTISLLTACEGSKKATVTNSDEHDVTTSSEQPLSPKEPQNTESEPEPSPEPEESETPFSFADISNLEFWYGSGVGAWCTVLSVHDDGSFEGQYHDSDMGDSGEVYPEGTVYLCDFTGKFTTPVKVNDYTYSVKIEEIHLDQEPKTEEIIDGTKYVYSEAYGLYDATDLLIYLPGASIAELPEDYKSWVSYSEAMQSTDTQLPFYGLFNVNTGDGFSSYDKGETSAIDDELAAIEQEAATIENKLQTEATTQLDMTQLSCDLYELWDNELNSIWQRLKDSLDSSTMDTLLAEQREWITYKDDEVEKAGSGVEGGSMQPMVENDKAADLTKERVYELADYLR